VEYRELSEAFRIFARASESLQENYSELQKRVDYLTRELEDKKRQLEGALADAESSRNYLEAVLNSMEEAIIVVDANSMIMMVNRAFEQLFGFSAEDLVGKCLGECDIRLHREGSEDYVVVDGEKIPVLFTMSPVKDGCATVAGQVIQIKDIRAFKEIEAQRLRNRRLIAMGEMTAKIVHELRNPMGGIELYATMLYEELKGTDKERLAHGISTGIRNLNNMLTNMLYFSREQKLKKEDVDIREVIRDAVSLIMPVVSSRGLALELDLMGHMVPADRELLKQVIMNLLMNAIQAIDGDGAIAVSNTLEDGFVVIRVRDTGIGIEEKDMERIFDPFYSTKPEGTGLGLAISARIVQAHGGYIDVQSSYGTGTEFAVRIPAGDRDAGAVRRLEVLAGTCVPERGIT